MKRHFKLKIPYYLIILLFIGNLILALPSYAITKPNELKTVYLGVLAKCGKESCLEKWSPTAEYLSRKIQNYKFQISPLGFDELLSAAESNNVNFILANPAFYVILEKDYDCQRIATLRSFTPAGIFSCFAGVIFTRADNKEIHNITDLKNKSFIGVHKYSFGGWLTALRELKRAGLNPYKDFKKIKFGGTHDKVVEAVLKGDFDAGTVRSGVLEKYSKKHKISINKFRVLDQQSNTCRFKLNHSTSDYPEWPIAKLKNTPDDLAKKVAIALFEMNTNDPACVKAHYTGWTIPHNYQRVHECLKELGTRPYLNYGKVKFFDILEQYWLWILGISIVTSIFFIYLNIRLRLVVKSVKKEIYQRALVESELQESEQRNRAILKAIPDLIFVYDNNGVFLDFSAKTNDDLLLMPEQFIGKNIKEVMPEKIAEGTLESIRKTLETGEIQSFDYMLENSHGKMYYESKNAVFGKDKVIAIVRDITKLMQSEIILRENEEKERKFREKLTALNDGTAGLSKCNSEDELWKQAVILGKNKLDLERLEIRLCTEKPHELRGTFTIDKDGNLIDKRNTKCLCDEYLGTAINQIINQRETGYYKEHNIIMDVETKKILGYADCAASPLWDGAKVIGLIITDNLISKKSISKNDRELLALYAKLLGHLCTRIRNEKKRFQLERQMQHAQKLESLGVLAGGIAHDFNNILMGVIGYAELSLKELSPSSPARDNIKEINKSACRAAELAKQMLAYSGKGKFLIEHINLNELIEEISHILDVSISKKAILKYNFADELPGFEGDITQIRQVIMNLITNASEALNEKSGVISISTGVVEYKNKNISDLKECVSQAEVENKTLDGMYVYIEVSDTGCGMDDDVKSKIFDPFFTTKFTGRGLGMAAMLGIVRGHNGIIELNSRPQKGTTFRIMFPANLEKIQSLKEHDDDKTSENEWQGNGTLLIADDEVTICAIGKYMLEQIGFKVITAYDGVEAVDVFKEHADEIVCVILDLTMPRLSGEEVFKEISTIKPGIKVILSSGYDEQDAMQRFSGDKIAGFVQKPYTFELLKEKLKNIL